MKNKSINYKKIMLSNMTKLAVILFALGAELHSYAQALKGNDYGHDWVDMGTSVMWATTDLIDEENGGKYFSFYGAGSAASDWGGGWRLPTDEEFKELIQKCDWTYKDGFYKFIAKNGNVLYLSNSGGRMEGSIRWCLVESGTAFYWSSTNSETYPDHANCLIIDQYRPRPFMRTLPKNNGCYARPVIKIFR